MATENLQKETNMASMALVGNKNRVEQVYDSFWLLPMCLSKLL